VTGTGLPAWPRLVALICRVLLRCFTRVRVEGLEHVPRSGALIIAPNHISNADPPLIGGWLAPALHRRPRFMAKEQLFAGVLGWFLRSQGVIMVKAGGSDVDAYRVARALVEAGEVMVIFPEGTRSADGRLGTPRPGVSLLATRHGVPVLPVGISGTDDFLRRGQRLPHVGARVVVRVGRPYQPVAERGGDRRAALAAADAELMRRIAALVEPRHRGDWEPWPDA
jgi:1-acyl-sn-glycerol-3-phosphate acyltransferase